MSDLVERLRAWGPMVSSGYECPAAGTVMHEAADRIEQLEAENSSLASWQCEFTDGKTGLVYGQGGTTFCIMAKRMQQLEAEAKTRTLDYLGQVGQLSEELERVRAALREIQELPGELNPSNCDHDDVVALNDAFVKTWQIASAALAAPSAALGEDRT